MEILGGVALVLFGVRFLRKGLDRLFGENLIVWLQRMTTSRWKAFLAGIGAGTFSPSSTALSMVAVHMMNTGNLTAERMLAVLLGSGIGLTVTVQLLALHITSYASVFLFIGVVGFQFLHRELYRGIGQCLIALGLIFFAMQVIGNAADAMASQQDAKTLLHILEEHPLAVLGFVTALAVLLQSSTAAIGLGIGLAHGGLLSAGTMIPWVLGANIGVGITLLLAGYRTVESRRLAVAHLLAKGAAVVAVLLFLPYVTSFVEHLPFGLERQAANLHTGLNVLIGLAAIPFVPLLSRVARSLVPMPPETIERTLAEPESFLNEEALEIPSLALAHATREALRMADESQQMLAGFWQAQRRNDGEGARQIQERDDRVDHIYRSLKTYLTRIHQDNLAPNLGRRQMSLLAFADELEAVGDIIDRHLCAEVIKQSTGLPKLAPDDLAALEEVYDRVRARLALSASLLAVEDAVTAKEFLAGKNQLSELCRKAQNAHHARLQQGDWETLQSSSYFLEMLGGFRRINSHLGALGYALASTEQWAMRAVSEGLAEGLS